MNLKTSLQKKLHNAKRVAILGIGSELRSDDVAGMRVAEKLKAPLQKKKEVKIFLGGTAPENLTGQIREFNPTHLVMIDSAEIGKRPGTITLIDPEKVGGVSFSTHQLPLKIMVDYLRESLNCEVIIIGSQPEKLTFGQPASKSVEKSAEILSSTLKQILK